MEPVDLTNLRAMIDEDRDLERQLIAEFYLGAENCLAELGKSLGGADAETWRRGAHALKGIAANLGAQKLSEIARKAQLGASAATAEKETMLGELSEEYRKVKQFLAALHPIA